ncbi:MAG: hypothetical protein MUF64_07285 [Polyangiaceae bacterium]|jgi:L-ascorbate metabolism protein UlaG (beta-lactamase superfamily)|nr:hypothetical protein [Polyangiaceae bacterium]
MSTNEEAAITFHGSTFVELTFQQTTLFLDPVFSSTRRGRRLRGTTRPCDYVLVTHEGDGFDDVLDLLDEQPGAILVGSERTCRAAQGELGLGRKRLLDLEAWERAGEDSFRVTAVPIALPSMLDDSMAMLDDLGGSGLGRLMPRGAARVPRAGLSAGLRVLEALPLLGNELSRNLRGRPALGYLFELTAGQRVLHLAGGVHGANDERELEDIASLTPLDVILLDVGAQGVDAVVRALRLFQFGTVLLYRSQDPYARGMRAAPQPVHAYIEAIQEDLGDAVEALHFREGDRFVLPAPEKKDHARNAPARASDAAKPAAKA